MESLANLCKWGDLETTVLTAIGSENLRLEDVNQDNVWNNPQWIETYLPWLLKASLSLHLLLSLFLSSPSLAVMPVYSSFFSFFLFFFSCSFVFFFFISFPLHLFVITESDQHVL